MSRHICGVLHLPLAFLLTRRITLTDGVESNWNEVVSSFDDMDLKEDLLRGALLSSSSK